ncbi:MAG: hypothetical protein HYT86_04700 [candidate division NC10 bacterium]|nr:hypothetical protein [candidate division NC10 bacterium]
MRRTLIVLFLSLAVFGVSAVPASARGGSDRHFKSGHHFRSFRHGFPSGTRLHHRHPFGHFRAFRHPHSIIFFPGFILPSHVCEPVRIPGRWVRIGSEWVWATEHWGCR